MNTKLLKKCIDELNKPEPNIDYLRGMLETLYEMQDFPDIKDATLQVIGAPQKVVRNTPVNAEVSTPFIKNDMSESEILDAEAKARLKNITDFPR